MDLTGTDCSDGLLRCRGGVIEASRRAVLPHPCVATEGEGARACRCPWDVVGKCVTGCAVDDLEVVLGASPRNVGPSDSVDGEKKQLCRASADVARPILPGDPIATEICAAAEIRCIEATVRVCDAAGVPSRAYARCLHGCAAGIGIADDEGPWANRTVDGAVMILCRRDDAERR